MRFEREQCLDLEAALARTWIATDGRGAVASGTVLGCPGSRRHGLLVAPLGAARVPHLFLARTEDWVLEGERSLPVSTGRYAGALFPSGHTYLASFDAWPHPRWRYLVGDVEVVRELLLAREPRQGPTLLLRWRVRGPKAPTRRLAILPLLACRGADALTFENPHADRRSEPVPGGFVAQPYPALPPLSVTMSGPAAFRAQSEWYRGYEHGLEQAHGEPAHEDHLCPGRFEVEVGARGDVVLAATLGPAVEDPAALWRRAARRDAHARAKPALEEVLARAVQDHLVETPAGLRVLDVLPGGRESLRVTWEALPLLLPALHRTADLGVALLAGAPEAASGAPGAGQAGAARAESLAWASAAARFADAPGRSARALASLDPALFALGERLREEAEGDPEGQGSGLLSTGGDGGARRLEVDVNARWAALATLLSERARGRGRAAQSRRRSWARSAKELAAAFRERFVLADGTRLASSWSDGAPDERLTPAVVVAAAERRLALPRALRRAVLAQVRSELLTPRGLRTLSPRDPAYHPAAAPRSPRGARAPQGEVQPRWLLAYLEAELLAHGAGAAVRARLAPLIEGFAAHLAEHGLAHVASSFDGEPPHRAGGAPSDALAAAALLAGLARVAKGRA